MFTGLIEEVGTLLTVDPIEGGAQLQVVAPLIAKGIQIGDSVAVNGCCLTVTAHHNQQFAFDLLGETLDRTNLNALRGDSRLNLERALAANARLGGHFVQGHVDCTARILAWEKKGADHRLEVELPAAFAHYVTQKGSIALNGISLTVAELLEKSFVVWIVSHTQSQTNLGAARVDDLVNLEFDLIAKYVERMLHHHVVPS
jgi:riboflavin synthase